MRDPAPDLVQFLVEQGLAQRGEAGNWTPLAGGVSSDIWRVETSVANFCVKRALAKLKVASDWQAPVDRNAYEWAYMEVVSEIAPGAVPRPLAHDPGKGLFAMAWLPPQSHRLWKSALFEGEADARFAAALGALIARIHAASARDLSLPGRFATDTNFHALRIDPYLLETARRHLDVAPALREIAARTAATRHALVHGDVSPKNILIGPHGPVLLDAEVAWFGDPAFDLAFCANHLAIKARILGARSLREAHDAFAGAYLAGVDWEDAVALERRAAALLPALALARVDGKSPLEYLDDGQSRSLRAAAKAAIAANPLRLSDACELLLAG